MNIYEKAEEFADKWWEELLKYERIEPGIIDATLLSKMVNHQGPKEQAGVLAREEGIEYYDILDLRIGLKNILKIANLWSFKNLVKLKLDNNSISKIEGLDHMVHLKWLDLSFNVIKKIENLNKLTNLRDLTLYHNQISVLENMDDLINLEVLSIGWNQIENIENTLYLRTFKYLRSVNFSQNPFTNHPNYRFMIIVYIPQLVSIDYSLISQQQRDEAMTKFENIVLGLEAKDQILQQEIDRHQREARIKELHKLMFVDAFGNDNLIDTLYIIDEEEAKMRSWPIIDNLFVKFYQVLVSSSKNIFEVGRLKHQLREEELRNYHLGAQETIEIYNQRSIRKINGFLEFKKTLWSALEKMDEKDLDMFQNEYFLKLTKLYDVLIVDEIALVDSLDEITKELELSLDDMISDFKIIVTSRLSSIRELIHRFYEDIYREATILAEKNRKPDEIDEIPADIVYLVGDKMLLSVTIQTCHETRVARLDNIQDDIHARLAVYVPKIIQRLNEHMEMKRNRKRIQEIVHFVNHNRNEGKQVFDVILSIND